MRKLALILAAAAALSVSAPARATTIVKDYGVTGTATGTFRLLFDTNTSLFSLTALNLLIGGTSWTTANAGLAQTPTYLAIGGNASGFDVLDPANDDFRFRIDTSGGLNSFFDIFVEVTPRQFSGQSAAREMPEPATWAMLLLGFGAIGLAMRRRRLPVAAWASRPVSRCPGHSRTAASS